MQKCEKIKKDSKNHNSKTIDRTEFCLAPSERKNISCFLATNFMHSPIKPQKLSNYPKRTMRKRRIQKAMQVSKSRKKHFFDLVTCI